MNLISTQIGFAERVRPQGSMGVSWQSFLQDKIEQEEAMNWQEKEIAREMRFREVREPSMWQKFKAIVIGFIP